MQEQIRCLSFTVSGCIPCVSVPSSHPGPPPGTFPDQGSHQREGRIVCRGGVGGRVVAQRPSSDPSRLLAASQVRQLQEDAARLQAAYAGDKAEDIQKRENEVLEAWKALLDACEGRRVRLVDTGDKFRFFSMVRDLMLWMEDVIRQIEAQEKPR